MSGRGVAGSSANGQAECLPLLKIGGGKDARIEERDEVSLVSPVKSVSRERGLFFGAYTR
jgi:hypothetical protein